MRPEGKIVTIAHLAHKVKTVSVLQVYANPQNLHNSTPSLWPRLQVPTLTVTVMTSTVLLHMESLVNMKPSEKLITDVVCSLKCFVISFTEVSFIFHTNRVLLCCKLCSLWR